MWTYEPATESTDATWTWGQYAVQDCKGYAPARQRYALNKYGPEGDFWVMMLGEFSSKQKAMDAAVEYDRSISAR